MNENLEKIDYSDVVCIEKEYEQNKHVMIRGELPDGYNEIKFPLSAEP